MKKIFSLIISVSLLCVSGASAATIKGKVTAHGVKNGANAVISIAKIPGRSFPAPKEHAHVDQRKLTFEPHVMAVLAGTTVEFQNHDANVLHNVYSNEACGVKFNVLGWPNQKAPEVVMNETKCATKLLCGYHSEMLGYVVPVETPYFAISGSDGGYTISNVPAGHYTLKIWHEKLPSSTREIDVRDGGDTTVDWDLHR